LAVITIEVYSTPEDQSIDFIGAPYEFWVGAKAPLGTSVGQMRTSWIQENEDEIMYDLLHTYSEGVPFAVEERSGIITVIRELSDFTRTTYNFEGIANYVGIIEQKINNCLCTCISFISFLQIRANLL